MSTGTERYHTVLGLIIIFVPIIVAICTGETFRGMVETILKLWVLYAVIAGIGYVSAKYIGRGEE